MDAFTNRFSSAIKGVISGFDRLVFRGHLQSLLYPSGLMAFLSNRSVLLKDFAPWVSTFTERLKADFQAEQERLGQEVIYVRSPSTDKAKLARQQQQEHQRSSGAVASFSCVEPCRTWKVQGNRALKRLEPKYVPGQCAHLYRYFDHKQFGFMHVRIQTWFPFSIQVCMNGREYLRRALMRERIGFEMRDNCFASIANWDKAQTLIDEMLTINWIDEINKFSDDIFPSRNRAVGKIPYHWSAYQTEWATDLAFNTTADLDALYPNLVKHALNTSDTATVLRFLGKKVTATGQPHGKLEQEVTARRVHRLPGTCVKFQVGLNALKFYNKHGCVFRVEATINKPSVFNIFRLKEGRLTGKQWLPMRMSVGDIKRRAEVSQHMNNRLLDHLAAVSDEQPLESLISKLAQPTTWHGERLRGLELFGKDRALVDLLVDPTITIAGIRNRDLAASLKKSKQGKGKSDKQRSGMATRLLRLLRAHGLIKKITKTHRYQLTDRGITAINAIKAALSASTKKLNELAA
jgi:hypothetical protein